MNVIINSPTTDIETCTQFIGSIRFVTIKLNYYFIIMFMGQQLHIEQFLNFIFQSLVVALTSPKTHPHRPDSVCELNCFVSFVWNTKKERLGRVLSIFQCHLFHNFLGNISFDSETRLHHTQLVEHINQVVSTEISEVKIHRRRTTLCT